MTGCATLGQRLGPEAPLGGHVIENVPPVAQKAYQCGPASLASVLHYWDRSLSADEIAKDLVRPGARGVLNFDLSQYGRSKGFWTQIMEAGPSDSQKGLEEMKSWILKKVPVIVMLKMGVAWVPAYHFVVVKGFNDAGQVFYANTGESDTYAIAYRDFWKRWRQAGNWYLVLAPPERVDWELDAAQSGELAFFSEKLGKQDLARTWYQRSLEKKPGQATVRFNLANIHLKDGRLKDAEEIYLSLLREKPDFGPAANNLAWVYLQQKRYAEARGVIENAFKNGAPKTPDILDTLENLPAGRQGPPIDTFKQEAVESKK